VDAGLLPVKTIAEAKQRLGAGFDPDERLLIARALLQDALDLCDDAPWLQWWVVSPDESVLSAAAARGLRAVHDPGEGLNRALESAMEAIRRAGAASVSVIPADVPLASPEDLMDLVDTGSTSDVVVVPATRGGGTNGLLMRPPGLLQPRFGPGSLQAHVELAQRLALRCSILALPRLALDIDTMEDVDELMSRHGGSRCGELLEQLRPVGPR
jgi:2-phospho-L-lactate guanylyltransferase